MMGHYATALVPYGRVHGAPLWLLLVCAQSLDLAWFGLAAAGVEPVEPTSLLDVSLSRFRTHMVYSHVGLGVLVIAAAVAAAVHLAYRRTELTAWCAVLVVGHWLCDLLSGFEHEVLVAGTPAIGFDLYARNALLAFVVEAVFCAVVVTAYVRHETRAGRAPSPAGKTALYATFVLGALAFAPNATHSIRELLGG